MNEKEILSQFEIPGESIEIPITQNNGNINKTFIAKYKMNNGEKKLYFSKDKYNSF